MTDLRTAAQQALEALQSDPNAMIKTSEGHWDFRRDIAITALRAALAEPVAPTTAEFPSVVAAKQEAIRQLGYYRKMMGTKAAPTVQEPVATTASPWRNP